MSEFNLKSSTLEKGLELAKDLLDKIAAPAAEELGLLISDNIKHRRLKNQINNLVKVRKIVDDNGLSLKEVNLKVLFPYLEGVSVEEDETLQDMWANLFANYIDSKSNLKLTVYPSILKQISTKEVEILKNASTIKKIENGEESYEMVKLVEGENSFELNNLNRLGLMINHEEINSFPTWNNRVHSYINQTGYYSVTNFGFDFIEACTLKGK